jgi:hypothetical protein
MYLDASEIAPIRSNVKADVKPGKVLARGWFATPGIGSCSWVVCR